MATIVVETGAGLTNSNSYVSESDLATYAADRGVTISGTAAVLLIQAMDYLESKTSTAPSRTLLRRHNGRVMGSSLTATLCCLTLYQNC